MCFVFLLTKELLSQRHRECKRENYIENVFTVSSGLLLNNFHNLMIHLTHLQFKGFYITGN